MSAPQQPRASNEHAATEVSTGTGIDLTPGTCKMTLPCTCLTLISRTTEIALLSSAINGSVSKVVRTGCRGRSQFCLHSLRLAKRRNLAPEEISVRILPTMLGILFDGSCGRALSTKQGSPRRSMHLSSSTPSSPSLDTACTSSVQSPKCTYLARPLSSPFHDTNMSMYAPALFFGLCLFAFGPLPELDGAFLLLLSLGGRISYRVCALLL